MLAPPPVAEANRQLRNRSQAVSECSSLLKRDYYRSPVPISPSIFIEFRTADARNLRMLAGISTAKTLLVSREFVPPAAIGATGVTGSGKHT